MKKNILDKKRYLYTDSWINYVTENKMEMKQNY